jgi:hypothetical protein
LCEIDVGSKHLRVAAENASEHAVLRYQRAQRSPAVAMRAPWHRRCGVRVGRAKQRGEK